MESKDIFAEVPTLQTKRLILREMTLDDAQAVFGCCSDPEVFKFTGGKAHLTIEDSKTFLKEIGEKYKKGESIVWGIFHRDDRKLIGDCAFINWSTRQGRAELDYLLSREYWNQGLMTEVVKEVIQFGFEKMGLNAHSVFVEKPFIPQAPDAEKTAHKWISGELFSYYHDWKIKFCEEKIFDCNSSGVPHKHAINRIVARKISANEC